jgi:hypothetical protein
MKSEFFFLLMMIFHGLLSFVFKVCDVVEQILLQFQVENPEPYSRFKSNLTIRWIFSIMS